MTSRAALATLLLAIAIANCPTALKSQVINTNNIEEFCRSSPRVTSRRTLVYADLSSIEKGKTDWGLTILNWLELGPREGLTVLGVNPESLEVVTVFDACYPVYSSAEVAQARASRSMWDKLIKLDPVDQQRENLQTFDARLRNALDNLFSRSIQPSAGRRRNILAAIAFDKNRFSEKDLFYRVIIFTNGVISEQGIAADAHEEQRVRFLIDRYPANFSGAEIQLFGASDGNDRELTLEARARIFSAYFLASFAFQKSFASSLPQQRGDAFAAVKRMEGSYSGGGTEGAAKFSLVATRDGTASDGWLSLLVGRTSLFVPFNGEFQCSGDECKLDAAVSEAVPALSSSPFFRKGDRLRLAGKAAGEMTGAIQAEAREVFKDGNQEVKYNLKFAK